MSACPDCAENIAVGDDARVTTIVVCPSCQVELEVIGLQPTELALAPEIEEDFGE